MDYYDKVKSVPGSVESDYRKQSNVPRKAGRTYVCHDFKGGYYENNDARDYSFHWWQYCDTLI